MTEFRADLIQSGAGPAWAADSPADWSLYRDGFRVGEVSIIFSGYRNGDVLLGASLEPFRALPRNCEIDVRVEWQPTLSRTAGRQLFDSGCTWRLYEDEAGFQFDFHVPSLGLKPYKRLLIDRRFSSATLQMSEQSSALLPYMLTPVDYPLDELLIMHRLTQERAIELHGSGIVRANGVGNLFVGHSGAGKSTTTRLWTEREEVEVLSDDRIIVRLDEGVEIPCRGAETAGGEEVLRLRDGSASRNHRFAQDDRAGIEFHSQDDNRRGMRMYGTPWHGEAMFASPNSAPLTRIFVLEHGHGNVITRLSRSQAVSELFARSFVPFHRHEYIESALSFLEQLTDSVPCYRYSFEPDEQAVEKIQRFND